MNFADQYNAKSIVDCVCRYYNLNSSDLLGKRRKQPIAEARQVALYLIRKFTMLSLLQIGAMFEKNHATVIYSIRNIETALQNHEPEIQWAVTDIVKTIHQS